MNKWVWSGVLMAVLFAWGVGTPAFAADVDPPEVVYGSQIMTEQERLAYRQRMMNAESAEERLKIRAMHHEQMQKRAREMGVTLPEAPPERGQGKGMGPAPGMGPGMGQGKGMHRGMGGR